MCLEPFPEMKKASEEIPPSSSSHLLEFLFSHLFLFSDSLTPIQSEFSLQYILPSYKIALPFWFLNFFDIFPFSLALLLLFRNNFRCTFHKESN